MASQAAARRRSPSAFPPSWAFQGWDQILSAARSGDSAGIKGGEVDAYWVAYDLLIRLCEEFIESGVSVILDLTTGWTFQRRHIQDIVERYPSVAFLPVILRCCRQTCLDRMLQRHEADPEYFDPPGPFAAGQKMLRIAEFLDGLDDPRIHLVDAGRTEDEVCGDVKKAITAQLTSAP